MKKYRLLLAVLIVLSGMDAIKAQVSSLSPFVISSSGGFFSNASGNTISATVAELAMVETFYNAGYLTQGFQQPLPDTITDYIIDAEGEGIQVFLFPNPAADELYITINSKSKRGYEVIITDIPGQKVMAYRMDKASPDSNESIDISTLAVGMYLITVLSDDMTFEATAPFIKQ